MTTDNVTVIRVFAIVLLSCGLFACQRDIPTLNASHRWQITSNFIIDASLSAKGDTTALLMADNSIALWNNATQQNIIAWPATQLVSDTMMLSVSDNADYVLSASKTAVQLWDASNPGPLGTLNLVSQLGDATITQITFWIAPFKLIIGTSAGDIIFADIQNNTYRVNRSHSADVVKLLLTRNADTLYSGGYDGKVIRWDLHDFEPVKTKTLLYRVTSLALGDMGVVFISDALDNQILWDSSTDRELGQLTYSTRFKWFRHALIDDEKHWLITSSPKAEIFLWDMRTLTLQGSWMIDAQGLGSTTEDMVLMEDKTLRTISSDGILQDWEINQLSQ